MLLITLIWGFNLVASKFALGELPPFFLTACRYVLLLVVLMPYLRRHPGQMSSLIFCALTLGALHFGLMILGLSVADDVSTVAIAIQLAVPFTTIVSAVWLSEHVGWRRWIGVALSFSGIVAICFDWAVFDYIEGLLLVIGAAFFAALGVPASKRLRNIGVLDFQAWTAAISAPILLAASILLESPSVANLTSASPMIWLAVAYSGLGASLLGHGGMYYLVQRYDVSLVAPMTLLAPLFGIVFGVTLMGDSLTLRIVIGGSTTLLGVYIIASRQSPDGIRRTAERSGLSDKPNRDLN